MTSASTAVLDMCVYKTMAGVLGEFVLGNLDIQSDPTRRNSMPYACDSVRRVALDIASATVISIVDFPVQDLLGNKYRVELASVNPNYIGKPYCYAYALTWHMGGSPRYEDMGLLKIDLCTGERVHSGALPKDTATVTGYSKTGVYFGEPVFVADPAGKAEDDGVLLIVSRDGPTQSTRLIILNARDFSEVASVQSPFPLMFEFHGQFFPAQPSIAEQSL